MNEIAVRLKEERERMGLNQTDFAALANHGRSVQAGYEQGRNIPGGAYLALLAKAGVDVLYVLTGQRTPNPGGVVAETEEEEKLIQNYRAIDSTARLNVSAVSAAFAQSHPKLKANE